MSKSKLNYVRRGLKNNPKVVIVAEKEKHNNYGWDHTVAIFVAPVTPKYTAEKLETFMLSLLEFIVPTPSLMDSFVARYWDKKYIAFLEFGTLYFDEEYAPGLDRRIWIMIYPDTEIAKGAVEDIHRYHILKSQLPPPQTFVVGFLNFLQRFFVRHRH